MFPFEMDTIVSLSGGRLVATHYGLHNTICGIGILAGNLLTGTVLDLARSSGHPAFLWGALALIGLGCATAVRSLDRAGRLTPSSSRAVAPAVRC